MSRTKKVKIIVRVPNDDEIIKQVKLDMEAAGFPYPSYETKMTACTDLDYEVEYEFD